jgi:hypothetical protein
MAVMTIGELPVAQTTGVFGRSTPFTCRPLVEVADESDAPLAPPRMMQFSLRVRRLAPRAAPESA